MTETKVANGVSAAEQERINRREFRAKKEKLLKMQSLKQSKRNVLAGDVSQMSGLMNKSTTRTIDPFEGNDLFKNVRKDVLERMSAQALSKTPSHKSKK